MNTEEVPIAVVHTVSALERLTQYNEATRKIHRVWSGTQNAHPLELIDVPDWTELSKGNRELTEDYLTDIGKTVKTRRQQLEESRDDTSHRWASTTTRDFEHATIETTLNEAASQLKNARDAL